MKTKWGIFLLLLAVAAIVTIFWPTAIGGKSPVNVMFLAVTNDGTGAKWILFCATNGTKRLFVRGQFRDRVAGHANQPDDNSPNHERRLSQAKSIGNLLDALTCARAVVAAQIHIH